MKNKVLMVFLLIAFLGGIFSLVFFYTKNKNTTSSSLPGLILKLTPTPNLLEVTPTPINPITQKGRQLIEDLDNLNQDMTKSQKTDPRLDPPLFYIEKEVLE